MANAYRIWGFATPIGWNCTIPEVAEALDLPIGTVRAICAAKGWTGRLRPVKRDIDFDSGGASGIGAMTPFALSRQSAGREIGLSQSVGGAE